MATAREPLSTFLPGASLSEAAQSYAAFRLCVFPVVPLKKRPAYGGHGWHDATGNQLQVRRWWKENPSYNIGISLPHSGLAVLDIDPRHGGDHQLQTLIDRHGPLPRTYTVRTGGQGWHYYFRFSDPDCDYPKKLASGVELIRNGYVIAPPSDTSNAESGGGLYVVENYNDDQEFAALPTRWIESIVSADRRREIDERLPADEDWFLSEGERNVQLTRYMGAMRRYGFNAEELVEMVKAWGPGRIEDFESVVDELPTIARSVAKYPPDSYGFEGIRISVRARHREPELDSRALYGPLGDWVRYVVDRSEAHPAALLMQALTIFGNRMGAEQHGDAAPGFLQGASYHRTALYVMIIGESGLGAKGDSWDYAFSLMRCVDPTFVPHEGVQTGEGFIDALADDMPTGEVATIQGEKVEHVRKGGQRDRRYFNFEPEYGRVLHVASRPGATIKDIVRALWDHGSTEKVTAGSKHKVTDVTLSMVAHITPPELERDFDQVDLMSGYGNRFLYCWSKRTKHLPVEDPVPPGKLKRFARPLQRAMDFAYEEAPEDYPFSDEAFELWTDLAEHWKKTHHPSAMVQALKSRFRPQVRRLAVIYAVSDESPVIELEHLEAASAVWDYSVQTVEYCLSNQIGDKIADQLYRALLENPSGLTKRQIFTDVFKSNQSASQIDRVTKLLLERNLIFERKIKTKTKPTTVLIARID